MKYTLITHKNYDKVPDVIEDYIFSLNIISEIQPLEALEYIHDRNDNEIFIITQIVLTDNYFNTMSEKVSNSRKVVFLNVEMLSESTRMKRIINIIERTNFTIADYSIENIKTLLLHCDNYNIPLTNKVVYFPYQFNIQENQNLTNYDNTYYYDIGIINAMPEKYDTVSKDETYRREKLWKELERHNHILDNKYRIINILGWGQERDYTISKCKIILNVHHFNCFNIHESIRCDRLVFAKKLIISDYSKYSQDLDLCNYMKLDNYDDILKSTFEMLDNFEKINNTFQSLSLDDIIENRKEILKKELNKIKNEIFYTYENVINNNINDKTNILVINGDIDSCNDIVSLKKTIFEIDFQDCNYEQYNIDEYENSFNSIFLKDIPDISNLISQFNNAIIMLCDKGCIYINNIYDKNNETWKFIYYLFVSYKENFTFESYKLLDNKSIIKINILDTFIIEKTIVDKIKNLNITQNYTNYLITTTVNI